MTLWWNYDLLLMTFKIIIKINKFDIRLNIYDGM